MPAEKIATTHVNNDGSGGRTNVLSVQWGKRGPATDGTDGWAPDSPYGWVGKGYAHVSIAREGETHTDGSYVVMDSDEIDHMIRVLKRVRRQAFGTVRPGGNGPHLSAEVTQAAREIVEQYSRQRVRADALAKGLM